MPRRYPSDLTDARSDPLEPMLPAVKPGRRPRKHDLHESMDSIRPVLRSDIA